MEEMITMAIQLHIGFIILALLLASYIYFVVGKFDNLKYAQKYEKTYSWYLMSLSVIGFTGLVVMAVEKFAFHWSFIWMIFIFFIMIVTSVKVYKLFKNTDRFDKDSITLFSTFAKKKYLLDIFLMLATGAFFYAVSL
jgi:nitrate reductase gamma subunit